MCDNIKHILEGMESFKFKSTKLALMKMINKDYEISIYGLGDINNCHQILSTNTLYEFSKQGKKKHSKCKLLGIHNVYLIGRDNKEYFMYYGHGDNIDNITSIVDAYMLVKCEYLRNIKAKIIYIDCYLKYDTYLEYGSIQATEVIKLYDCIRLKVKAIMCKYIEMSALREVDLNIACLENTVKICAASYSWIYISYTNKIELLSISNSTIVIGSNVKEVYLQNCFDSKVIIVGAYSDTYFRTKHCYNINICGLYDEEVDDKTRGYILEYKVETEYYIKRELNERT